MKSDVIRKRSRHDARRAGHSGATNASDTPSASRSGSPNASPDMERSPTLAPDSTTAMAYDFSDDSDFHTSQSELMGALGNMAQNNFSGIYSAFPGPYHPDYLAQHSTPADALPFAAADVQSESEKEVEQDQPRSSKRRRMSTDSASEPPSSAVSFSSQNDGYSSQSSATSQSQTSHSGPSGHSQPSHSRNNSMDFPFNHYPSYNILRGSSNTFWHPPMSLSARDSPQFIHPPMLPPDDSPMDYLHHPPMLPQEEENLFNQYLHPPMIPSEDGKAVMGAMPAATYNSNGATNGEFYDSQMHHF